MKWAVLIAGVAPDDLDDVLELAHATHTAEGAESGAVNSLLMSEPDGLLVIGSDADLAGAALEVRKDGRRLPIALLPSGPSDLLRMFGLDRTGVLNALQTGSRYSTDLGECAIDSTIVPFVSHVAARCRGLSGVGAGRPVVVSIGERSHQLQSALVVVTNTQHFKGRTIAPRAAVMDGQLDFQSIAGTFLTRARSLRRAASGHHLRDRNVWRRSAPMGEVTVGRRWSVSADSRPVGAGPFGVRVVPEAFDLWI
jgi:hypothetical protein